jgi:hypothetical protein
MPALRIHAGPAARRHIERHGLSPKDVRLVAGAAGGPKGLILGPLDRFVFGEWLRPSSHTVHLLGASIGAWRMATAAMRDPVAAFEHFEQAYINQHYDPEPGRKMPSAALVSRKFKESLHEFFAGEVDGILRHPRYRVHVVTSRGQHVLAREGRLRTPLGYLGLALSNAVSRRSVGAWTERVVFSSAGAPLPVDLRDLKHRCVALTEQNFHPAVQASCSIPFVLQAVHDIPGAPRGAYWDGGITDYHLHWRYQSMNEGLDQHVPQGLVLYPHFQRELVPGWLDKAWKRRHKPTAGLDNVIVLAPDPDWVRQLPNAKLPDRNDFTHYGLDWQARARSWTQAVGESQRLADEWQAWLDQGAPASRIEPL